MKFSKRESPETVYSRRRELLTTWRKQDLAGRKYHNIEGASRALNSSILGLRRPLAGEILTIEVCKICRRRDEDHSRPQTKTTCTLCRFSVHRECATKVASKGIIELKEQSVESFAGFLLQENEIEVPPDEGAPASRMPFCSSCERLAIEALLSLHLPPRFQIMKYLEKVLSFRCFKCKTVDGTTLYWHHRRQKGYFPAHYWCIKNCEPVTIFSEVELTIIGTLVLAPAIVTWEFFFDYTHQPLFLEATAKKAIEQLKQMTASNCNGACFNLQEPSPEQAIYSGFQKALEEILRADGESSPQHPQVPAQDRQEVQEYGPRHPGPSQLPDTSTQPPSTVARRSRNQGGSEQPEIALTKKKKKRALKAEEKEFMMFLRDSHENLPAQYDRQRYLERKAEEILQVLQEEEVRNERVAPHEPGHEASATSDSLSKPKSRRQVGESGPQRPQVAAPGNQPKAQGLLPHRPTLPEGPTFAPRQGPSPQARRKARGEKVSKIAQLERRKQKEALEWFDKCATAFEAEVTGTALLPHEDSDNDTTHTTLLKN